MIKTTSPIVTSLGDSDASNVSTLEFDALAARIQGRMNQGHRVWLVVNLDQTLSDQVEAVVSLTKTQIGREQKAFRVRNMAKENFDELKEKCKWEAEYMSKFTKAMPEEVVTVDYLKKMLVFETAKVQCIWMVAFTPVVTFVESSIQQTPSIFNSKSFFM
jgi:hypothetical protein